MNKQIVIAVLLAVLFSCFAGVAYAQEQNDGKYFTIVDENGVTVYITGWGVKAGDQFLTDKNIRYEITSVEGDIAHAQKIGEVNLGQYLPPEESQPGLFSSLLKTRIAKAQGGKVAVYHTHSDESYVPTDGKESILGAGGIYKVGDVFTKSLQSKGLEVIHSQAKHDPHDDMAYERSRRTAMDLVKQQPAAIFDIHRDAVPPQVYKATINGEDVTKVQLVVGKYGPTGKQIEDYALQIKAASDKQHPGLVKGIFFAKGGDYNQDLHPRSMLLEVGAHTNDRASAERGVALFADVIPTVLGTSSAAPTAQNGAADVGTAATGPSGAMKSIGWIVGLLVVGVVAFLFLSTGSLKEAGAKVKQFTSTEFANFLAPKKRQSEQAKSKEPQKREDQE